MSPYFGAIICNIAGNDFFIYARIELHYGLPADFAIVRRRVGRSRFHHTLHATSMTAVPTCWRVGGTALCAGAPRGVVAPCGPPAVLCAPLWWARAPCAAPPRCCCCGPGRDHCYDRLEATAPHRIHSLAPWRHQGSGHPHAYGLCVRRAGTVHAVIHSPQQAFSQQSSGAAASRSHSSATNMVAALVMLP